MRCSVQATEATISCHTCRHPESSRRPGFRDLLLGLVGNEGEVLSIPNSHKGGQAVVLGAPLSAAETLYPDLQNFYK